MCRYRVSDSTSLSMPLTNYQQTKPVEASKEQWQEMSLDWDKKVPHKKCEDALLRNAPAVRDKLRQMEEALSRRQFLRYREHRRVLGDILKDLQEMRKMPAAAAANKKKSGERENKGK